MARRCCRQFSVWLGILAVPIVMMLATVPAQAHKKPLKVDLEFLGTYQAPGNVFDEGVAEIVAHDPRTQRLFMINGSTSTVDVLDFSDPTSMHLLFSIDITPFGVAATSVAVKRGIVAVAVPANVATDPGKAVFFDTDGNLLNAVTVGVLPDMITFTPDGRYVLTANEGQPSDDYTIDPPGSVSIIPLWRGCKQLKQLHVRTAGFERFNSKPRDPSIRIYGPNATVAQDLEPEYITVSDDSRKAWVTLQENNAIGILDIKHARFEKLVGLGFKDHSQPGNALDASDRDNAINIANWPVFGMYEPDSIAHFRAQGKTYLITANEGDTRDYDGFSEEARVSSLTLDPIAFPNAADLQANAALGRLTVTNATGDTDGDGDFDWLFVPGGRSFSIWSARGKLVYDSGHQFEQITAAAFPANFNASNTNNNFDDRSDNKGPEPEGVTVAELWGRNLAFIGLERIGGVMVFDVSDPEAPAFVTYANHRDFSADPESGTAGNLAPEGLFVVSKRKSPIHEPLLVVGNEVSGTVTAFRIKKIVD